MKHRAQREVSFVRVFVPIQLGHDVVQPNLGFLQRTVKDVMAGLSPRFTSYEFVAIAWSGFHVTPPRKVRIDDNLNCAIPMPRNRRCSAVQILCSSVSAGALGRRIFKIGKIQSVYSQDWKEISVGVAL